MAAIWYRHWLELRTITKITCVMTLLAAIGYGFAVYGTADYFARTGNMTQQIARYEAIRQMGTGPELVPGAIHALVAAFFALWGSSVLAGSGFGQPASARFNPPRHSSVYFSLSLPLSRARLQTTRLWAGFGSLLAILGLSLVAHVIALLIVRQPIPILAMGTTTLTAALGGLGLMAFVGFVAAITSEGISGLVSFGVVMSLWLSRAGWNGIVSFVQWPRIELLAGAILTSAALIGLTIVVTRRKDL